MQVRDDLTVIMVAPKCPGTEVREEYKRGFGVPTLIAVHPGAHPSLVCALVAFQLIRFVIQDADLHKHSDSTIFIAES